MDSQASSSDEEDDERTISTVATDADTAAADADAFSICDMLHDDPEFDSLRLNSIVTSRVPDEVTTIDDLEEGETDDKVAEDKFCKNIQELEVSETATGPILTANRHEAHLDGGLQASTTNDKSVLWGFKLCTKKNPCQVRLTCADGKTPVVPEGCGAARIPANNAEGCVPTKCHCTPDIPNFILSPNSFKPLLGEHHNGHAPECNDEKKTFSFAVNHKKRMTNDTSSPSNRQTTRGETQQTMP